MDHYLTLGRIDGWKPYVWHRVQQIDKDTSGLFKGFKEDFLNRIAVRK